MAQKNVTEIESHEERDLIRINICLFYDILKDFVIRGLASIGKTTFIRPNVSNAENAVQSNCALTARRKFPTKTVKRIRAEIQQMRHSDILWSQLIMSFTGPFDERLCPYI